MNVSNIVATTMLDKPNNIMNFELITREREPVKDIAKAKTPMGILSTCQTVVTLNEHGKRTYV